MLFQALTIVSVIMSTLALACSGVAVALWYGQRLSTHKIQYMPAADVPTVSQFLQDIPPEEVTDLDPFAGFPRVRDESVEPPFMQPLQRASKHSPNPEDQSPFYEDEIA